MIQEIIKRASLADRQSKIVKKNWRNMTRVYERQSDQGDDTSTDIKLVWGTKFKSADTYLAVEIFQMIFSIIIRRHVTYA